MRSLFFIDSAEIRMYNINKSALKWDSKGIVQNKGEE